MEDQSQLKAASSSVAGLNLHIEVLLKENATCRIDAAEDAVRHHLETQFKMICVGKEIPIAGASSSIVTRDVQRIVFDSVDTSSLPSLASGDIVTIVGALSNFYIYKLHECESSITDSEDEISETEDSNVVLASVVDLPSKKFDGLWDTLIYDDQNLKTSLLDYISSMMFFSSRRVDSNLISFYKLVLLHGPPGTGKTSLCRALAQKLVIRSSNYYAQGKLIEVRANSLFSRFFSESAKLVTHLFEKIHDYADNEDWYICVLFDEIESLAMARNLSLASEPSDIMRVVNVLLTQLDRLRHRKNVLVLSTSNLLETFDSAFLDRADMIKYIGNPGTGAAYEILRSCLSNLLYCGVIQKSSSCDIPSYRDASFFKILGTTNIASQLLEISELCTHLGSADEPATLASHREDSSLSGRALRRLPLLAHARYTSGCRSCTMEAMLSAMKAVVLETRNVPSIKSPH